MGLLSKLTGSQAESADDVQQARTRARRRLIGAVLLLGVGLIGFPLLFETQPRPIPVDIPIQIPRKDNAPPLALPAPKMAAAPAASAASAGATPKLITETAAEAGRELPPPEPPKVAVTAAAPAASKPAITVAANESANRPSAAEAARAKALLEGAATAKAPPPAAAVDEGKGRFVVQVGAYADASAARDTRAKVEKLGLKTYTQVVDTDAGKRIRVRVGPFASRDDASKAAGKISAAGLPTALLSL
jgi:DedD protein